MIGIAQFLQMYGGWAIAAITLIALAHVYKATSTLLEKRHTEFVSILKEASTALSSTSNSVTKMIAVLDKMETSMSKDDALIKEVKQLMEFCRQKQMRG